MTLVLVAAGLMVALAVAVFGLALCVTAARADEVVDRELAKRARDMEVSGPMNEER